MLHGLPTCSTRHTSRNWHLSQFCLFQKNSGMGYKSSLVHFGYTFKKRLKLKIDRLWNNIYVIKKNQVAGNRQYFDLCKLIFIHHGTCTCTSWIPQTPYFLFFDLQILQCALMFPHLSDLHVCFNCIRQLAHPGTQLSHLRLLNLEANSIESWAEILNVGCLAE